MDVEEATTEQVCNYNFRLHSNKINIYSLRPVYRPGGHGRGQCAVAGRRDHFLDSGLESAQVDADFSCPGCNLRRLLPGNSPGVDVTRWKET
jgi:hypothetical protein